MSVAVRVVESQAHTQRNEHDESTDTDHPPRPVHRPAPPSVELIEALNHHALDTEQRQCQTERSKRKETTATPSHRSPGPIGLPDVSDEPPQNRGPCTGTR